MEKLEWREIFNRQPVFYLFFDFTEPISLDNVSIICQVLQNITALSNSLKGSSRFTMLGVYAISERTKCIFPLQSVKNNYMKLQISLDSFLASRSIIFRDEIQESSPLTGILHDAVNQYEKYFQSAMVNAEEWPQMQMLFFSSQTSQNFMKMVQKALPSVQLAYISKIQAGILRSRGSSASSGSNSPRSNPNACNSPVLFRNDEIDDVVSSLIQVTEMDANEYQLESVLKQWLHDYSNDSDHLRLTVGRATLRCDLRECMLSPDALPVAGQFFLLPEGGGSQNVVRPTSAANKSSKFPVHALDGVALVEKEGLCESVLFGNAYVAVATRCWKIDWDELDRNQQLFAAVTQHLEDRGLVLIAKKRAANHQASTEKALLPTGYFAFLPSRRALLVKSVAAGELMLPGEELTDKEIPEKAVMEAKECLESLENKVIYNPLTMASGLYPYLKTSQSKRMRPATNFVAPILAQDEDRAEVKKSRKKASVLPTLDVSSSKQPSTGSLYGTDFMTASTLLKRSKLLQNFE